MPAYMLVGDAIGRTRNEFSAEVLNRLVRAVGPVWRDLIGTSDQDLKRHLLAMLEEIRAGRRSPTDPPFDALLMLRMVRRLGGEYDPDAADLLARRRAFRALRTLMYRQSAQIRMPVTEGVQAHLHPMVIFHLTDLIDRLWQDGKLELWVRASGQGAAVKVEPIGRKLNLGSGPRLGEWVIDWTTRDPNDVWRDDRKDLWRNPYMTAKGYGLLRSEVRTLVRPTAAQLDQWMAEHSPAPGKYAGPAIIAACRQATGATFREAKDAWGRRPSVVKLERGENLPQR
jgi:hypothetical protein